MKLSRRAHSQLEEFFREFFDDENLRLPEIEIFCRRGARIVTKIVGADGITFNRFIFIRPDLIYHDELRRSFINKNLLAHEATHVLQYQKLGTLKFLYRYLKSYFTTLRRAENRDFHARLQAYLEIPYETEARAAGMDFVDWLENRNGRFQNKI